MESGPVPHELVPPSIGAGYAGVRAAKRSSFQTKTTPMRSRPLYPVTAERAAASRSRSSTGHPTGRRWLNSLYPETLGPLPFHAMSRFPYPESERYPDDDAHRSYRRNYNTRVFPVRSGRPVPTGP